VLFDSRRTGPEGVTREDRRYRGSTFADVRAAIFANSYYLVWGARDEPPLPVYEVTLGRTLMGLGRRWHFQHAANRSVDSGADLRWGPDAKGFRRLLHPNGVCLTGTWEIDPTAGGTNYTGYFKGGSQALIVGRYSTCCTETRRGRYRSLALAGKLYPTTDPDHKRPLRTVSFITQEDFGGSKSREFSDVELRNAPDTTPWRRGAGFPILLLTGFVLLRADKEPTFRQVYEIAELGKAEDETTRAPEFMRLIAEPSRAMAGDDLDFRDEILGQIYDEGNGTPQRTLTFHIEVSDKGTTHGRLVQRRTITEWKRIGRIVFQEAVASYNGDCVIHFHHPLWRNDRNDPSSLARPRRV
jgi:hypothetical protein